jgi:cystathionine beta-lyase/cystathionine gamma-synthase
VPDPAGYAAHDENVDFAQSFPTATTPAADVTFRRRGGVVVVGDNADLRGRVAFVQNAVGAIQGPFDSFLALRGVKTLALRMERQSPSALRIGSQSITRIERVHYPARHVAISSRPFG